MSDENPVETPAAAELAPSAPADDKGPAAPQAVTAPGDPAARKADGVKPPQAAVKPPMSSDDHYTRGRKATEARYQAMLEERYGVSDFDALDARLGKRTDDGDDGDGEAVGKGKLPDVRELKRAARTLAEQLDVTTKKAERAERRLTTVTAQMKLEALRAELSKAGARYVDDEVAILASRIGVSSEWKPEEIDEHGVATGRSLAQVVAERREARPDMYRGDSRDGAGSRPPRTVPTATTPGNGAALKDASTAEGIRQRLAAKGIGAG